jgi:hypothetical protein
MIRSRFKNQELYFSIGLVILLAVLAYLPLALQLGYYRDDWHVVWGGFTQGPAKIIDLHVIDRPGMGVIYAATYAILRDSPLAWHLYAFFMRTIGGLAFLWLARMVFPGKPWVTTSMAALFIVYPGFLQQPTANAYSNHLVGFAAGIFSIACSLRVALSPRCAEKILLTLLAMLSELGCFLIMEYMIGLEGVRLALLLLVLQREMPADWRKQAARLARRWLPYLVVLAGFLVWRVIFFKSARSVTDVGALGRGYLAAPLTLVLRLVFETARDLLETTVLAWGVPLYNTSANAGYAELAASLLLGLLGGGLVWGWNRWQKKETPLSNEPERPEWTAWAIWIGLVSVLVTLVPVVISNRDVRFQDTFDRYTLPGSLGVALLLVGLIYRYLREPARPLLIAALVGLSLVTHYNNAVFFKNFWNYERQMWWQLSWRAPNIMDDTLLVPHLPGAYTLAESYEVWGPANLIYNPESASPEITGEALNDETVKSILKGDSLVKTIRRVNFTQDFKNLLLVTMPSGNSCLHVVDSNQIELPAAELPIVRLAAPYSKIDRILPDDPAHTPPQVIFGSEPAHDWCYYYQKASLARQHQDWEEVVRLGAEAASLNLKPKDASEWLPFYEGYARTSRMDEANTTAALIREDRDFLQMYCLQYTPEKVNSLRKGSVDEFLIINLCPQP